MTATPATRRLTEFSHGAGCACKLAPGLLADLLETLPVPAAPQLLVGTETGDDAAVWRLDADRALVATTDFFTPLVDDARTWGRIAAQNAASDVYAMGGRPLFALNLVAWPSSELPTSVLAEVLAGGAEIAAEGGFVVAGGHSVDDPEPKYGLAVVGEVHPERVLRNSGLRDGDALVLTKPLGIGITTTGIKLGVAPEELVALAVETMTASNAAASRAAVAAGATGCTDVTGFGLLGHLRKRLPRPVWTRRWTWPPCRCCRGFARSPSRGCFPGGSRRNRDWVQPHLDGGDELDVLLLADAQTSGGLLFGASPERARAAVDELAGAGVAAAVIGEVRAGRGRITLR